MGEVAMENAYNICHNVQVQLDVLLPQKKTSEYFLVKDFLFFRGIQWEGKKKASKKKKKKKII